MSNQPAPLLSASQSTRPAGRARRGPGSALLWTRGFLGRHLSVRWKLTLWYALIYSATLIVIAVLFPVILDRQTEATVDASLRSTATQLITDLSHPPRLYGESHYCPGDPSVLVQQYCRQVVDALDRNSERLTAPGQFEQVQVFHPDGALQFDYLLPSTHAPSSVPVDPRLTFPTDYDGQPRMTSLTLQNGEVLRLYLVRLQVPLALQRLHFSGVLEVFQAEHTYVEIQRAIVTLLLLGAPLGLLLALLVGWWVARAALRPIGRIARTVSVIGESGDLTRRIEYEGPRDELSRLADTFDGMMDRLQTVFETQKRFIADASHELRTPLTAIRGNADLLEIAPADERAVCIASIRREAQRMSRLVSDLLLMAEADVAQHAVHRQRVDLCEILLDTYRSGVALAGDKVSIYFDPPESVEVEGDPDRLKQLMLNLLDNAIKFTPRGGSISLSLATTHDQALIKVSDTGVGIPLEEQDAIFRRFYRVEASRSTRGSGLGLSLCAWIAEAHGGSIDVRSKPGQGSTFTVRLPLAPASGHADQAGIDKAPIHSDE